MSTQNDDLDLIADALSLWAKRAEADLASPAGLASTPEDRGTYARRMERAAYLAGLCASRRCEDGAMLLAALKPDLMARGTLPLVVVTRDDVLAVLNGDDSPDDLSLSPEQADVVLDKLDDLDFEWAEWVRDAHDLL